MIGNMGKKQDKTNVMRILDQKSVSYDDYTYDDSLQGAVEVANALGQDVAALFKTLVTVGRSGAHCVFMVPGDGELDLKKAAKAAGEKALEMIPQKALLPLTGYVHGGCSPIGMKKQFPTFIDASAEQFETICFSAGRVGRQVRMRLEDLRKVMPVTAVDVVKE